MSNNLKPRMQSDLPDDAISIANMLEGKILEFKNDFMSSTRERKPNKKFNGLFKSLEDRAELAKQAVILDGLQMIIKEMGETPEALWIEQVDGLISKMETVQKTNLPVVPKRDDGISELDEDETSGDEKNE